MSVVEIEKALDSLPMNEQRDILLYLLQKFEDWVDAQSVEAAMKEGRFRSWDEVEKELHAPDSDCPEA